MNDAEFLDLYFKLHLAIGGLGVAVGLFMVVYPIVEHRAFQRYLKSCPGCDGYECQYDCAYPGAAIDN